MTIKDAAPLPSIDDVQNLETILGVELPNDYKQFLLEKNAIHICTYWFTCLDRDYAFSWFLPIRNDKDPNLLTLNKNLSQDEDAPEVCGKHYLLFALDFAGEPFIMSLKKDETYGRIYYHWQSDQLPDAKKLMANNFTELVSKLTYFEENPIEK